MFRWLTFLHIITIYWYLKYIYCIIYIITNMKFIKCMYIVDCGYSMCYTIRLYRGAAAQVGAMEDLLALLPVDGHPEAEPMVREQAKREELLKQRQEPLFQGFSPHFASFSVGVHWFSVVFHRFPLILCHVPFWSWVFGNFLFISLHVLYAFH